VVTNGRPLVFEWTGTGPMHAVPISFSGAASVTDTLRFDGAGRAEVWLAPGSWRYRLEGGTQGLVAVEAYSEELLPRTPSLASKPGSAAAGNARTAARDWAWLFGIAVLGLCGEWLIRRRLGLR
jgi:hypothetical protein